MVEAEARDWRSTDAEAVLVRLRGREDSLTFSLSLVLMLRLMEVDKGVLRVSMEAVAGPLLDGLKPLRGAREKLPPRTSLPLIAIWPAVFTVVVVVVELPAFAAALASATRDAARSLDSLIFSGESARILRGPGAADAGRALGMVFGRCTAGTDGAAGGAVAAVVVVVVVVAGAGGGLPA